MPTASTKNVFDWGDKIHVSPPIWSNQKLDIQPGDLSKFVPYGNGIDGYQNREGNNPFTNAPLYEIYGGVIYFGNSMIKPDFETFIRIMEVWQKNDFAVFTAESSQPRKDGYLTQMRIVSKFGLRFMFHALTETEYENFPEQELTIVETLWSFIKHEQKRWGTSFKQDSIKGLRGLFGGDGNCAREELAFGFMVENSHHRICRIWSRAWLVTT